jgi:hypothetical protein
MLTKLKISFLKWQIRHLAKGYHLAKNPVRIPRKRHTLENTITEEYQRQAIEGKLLKELMGNGD